MILTCYTLLLMFGLVVAYKKPEERLSQWIIRIVIISVLSGMGYCLGASRAFVKENSHKVKDLGPAPGPEIVP